MVIIIAKDKETALKIWNIQNDKLPKRSTPLDRRVVFVPIKEEDFAKLVWTPEAGVRWMADLISERVFMANEHTTESVVFDVGVVLAQSANNEYFVVRDQVGHSGIFTIEG